jgi:hypothetical protein
MSYQNYSLPVVTNKKGYGCTLLHINNEQGSVKGQGALPRISLLNFLYSIYPLEYLNRIPVIVHTGIIFT